MSSSFRINVCDTVISVFKNENVVFTYNYMDLYSLWRKGFDHDYGSDPDGEYCEPEGYHIRLSDDKLMVCLLEASDQAGILGIVNVNTGILEHTQEASYCCACEICGNKVITLHLIHHYGVYPYYQVQISEIGAKDFREAEVYFNLPKDFGLQGYLGQFNLSLEENVLFIRDESIEGADNTFRIDVSAYVD